MEIKPKIIEVAPSTKKYRENEKGSILNLRNVLFSLLMAILMASDVNEEERRINATPEGK